MVVLNYLKRRIGHWVNGEPSPAPSRPAIRHLPSQEAAHVPRLPPAGSYLAGLEDGEIVPTKAYTHGFESIYALENVDLRTVRPLGGGERSPPKTQLPQPSLNAPSPKPSYAPPVEFLTSAPTARIQESVSKIEPLVAAKEEPEAPPESVLTQLEMDFGASFRSWIEPFYLSEPIQVLDLSAPALKGFLENGKRTLKDLLDVDPKAYVQMRGLGQGHIDEMREKLRRYTQGRSSRQTYQIDFKGLLLSLLAAEERKGVYLWVSAYGLQDLFPLSASDNAELRHLSTERRAQLREMTAQELSSDRVRRPLQDALERVTNAFIRPWIRGRKGLASAEEIEERLQQLSSSGSLTQEILNFLKEAYYGGKTPCRQLLVEVEPGLYAADKQSASLFQLVKTRARTYFYQNQVRYSLETLESYLLRELATQWQSTQEGFVQKVLRYSGSFCVRKNEKGQLEVYVR